MDISNEKLILRFCKADEVGEKRQNNLNAKSTFLSKIKHMRQKGKKFDMMMLCHNWVEKNWQNHYPGFNSSKSDNT